MIPAQLRPEKTRNLTARRRDGDRLACVLGVLDKGDKMRLRHLVFGRGSANPGDRNTHLPAKPQGRQEIT